MDFAFLVHSRDYRDVEKKFKIARYLSQKLVEFWCLHWPPIVVSKITGLKNITGWIIGIPMTAKQMLEKRELAQKRIFQAIKKAERLGAKIVGLGALTSPLTNGGVDLIGKVKIKITNGNALTAAVIFEDLKKILRNNNQIQKIGIVGATGSIGQTVTKLLSKDFSDKEFFLFARTKENLKKLNKALKKENLHLQIKIHANNLEPLKNTDLVLVATSAAEAIIHPSFLKKGAFVYDITQPPNLSIKTLKNRPDLKIQEGGLVIIPELENTLPFGLPPKVVFACFAETMLLAKENIHDNFSIGKVKLEKINTIYKIFQKYNFDIYEP